MKKYITISLPRQYVAYSRYPIGTEATGCRNCAAKKGREKVLGRWREARQRQREGGEREKRERSIVATSAICADLRRFPVAWPIFSPRVANPLALPVSRVTSLVHFCACALRLHRESSFHRFRIVSLWHRRPSGV